MPHYHRYEGRLVVTLERAFMLRSADFGSSSDPFAVVSLYSGKKYTHRKSRTHTIDNTLNPEWNCRLEFDHVDVVDLTIYVEIYDADLFGPSDLLGTCRIEVPQGPTIMQAYRKLETRQRKPAPGAVILKMEWIPSGDLRDDEVEEITSIETVKYEGIGELFIRIIEAQDLAPVDITKQCDSYAVVRCVGRTGCNSTTQKTSVQFDTVAPVWDETLRYHVDYKSHEDFIPVEIEVFQLLAGSKDVSLGITKVDVPPLDSKLKALKLVGASSTLLLEVHFEPLGEEGEVPEHVVEHIDAGAKPNVFDIRQRLADVSALLRATCAERDEWENVAAEAKKQMAKIAHTCKIAQGNEAVLERRLANALERNDRLRIELRHADEVYGVQRTSTPQGAFRPGSSQAPKTKTRKGILDALADNPPSTSGTALPIVDVGASPSNDAPTSPLMRVVSKQVLANRPQALVNDYEDEDEIERQEEAERVRQQQICQKSSAMWLLFNRIVEDWGPKVRNELLSSLLEGSVHPARTHKVSSAMAQSGDFLTFDEFVRVVDQLNMQKNEWKCMVRAVRNISVR